MSWTVHEDAYATAAPNVEDILKQVVDDDDDCGDNLVQSTNKYTRCSQVFSSATASLQSHAPLTLTLPTHDNHVPPRQPPPPAHHQHIQQQQQRQMLPSTSPSLMHARYAHSAQPHRRVYAALPLSSSSSSSLTEVESLRAWLPPPPPANEASVTLAPPQHVPCTVRLHSDAHSSHHGSSSSAIIGGGESGGSQPSSSSAGRVTYTGQHALYSASSAYTPPLHDAAYNSYNVARDRDAMYDDKRTPPQGVCADMSTCVGFTSAAAATATTTSAATLPHPSSAAAASGYDARVLLGTTSDDEWLSMAFVGNGDTPPYARGLHPMHGAELTAATAALVPLDTLRGKVYETAKDQHGCRYLQRWLDANGDAVAVRAVVQEIAPHIAELMTDQYANFLVQKLFDVMPDDVRYLVARTAAPHMVQIALTPHGTFSVQKMIETITSVAEMQLVRDALAADVITLVKDAHGNHVVQKILQRFDYADKEFIYEAVAQDCAAVARDKQGCCVLQRCLEYASAPQRDVLVQCILSCCLQLVQDPFGNYVLQYVLQANDGTINDTIAIAFLPHLVQLCMNKFSSNVMEKVLRGASPPIQEMYVEAMCNADVVACLVQDDYGNYVLQTALSLRYTPQTEALVLAIRPLMPLVKNAPYAKKLESKMDAVVRKSLNAGVLTGTGASGGFDAATYRYGATTMAATTDAMQRARPTSARNGRATTASNNSSSDGVAYARCDRMRAEMYLPGWDSQA